MYDKLLFSWSTLLVVKWYEMYSWNLNTKPHLGVAVISEHQNDKISRDAMRSDRPCFSNLLSVTGQFTKKQLSYHDVIHTE